MMLSRCSLLIALTLFSPFYVSASDMLSNAAPADIGSLSVIALGLVGMFVGNRRRRIGSGRKFEILD